jgi:hypothetical protein
MLYNSCTGIYKFGNNTYPWRIRRRSNLGHIFREKKCVLRAGKYSKVYSYTLLSTTCFGSSYEPSAVCLLFLSKVKFTISNPIVIINYKILYNVCKIFRWDIPVVFYIRWVQYSIQSAVKTQQIYYYCTNMHIMLHNYMFRPIL